MITRSTRIRLGALLAAGALAFTGCASATPAADTDTVTVAAGDVVTISDAWVKAAESGMSAGFGELINDSDTDVTVVSATTEAASMVELHETAADDGGQMVMREVEGGFVIPANGALTLEPGGNHLMLMGLTAPLAAGEEVEVTLTFSDDSTYAFTAPVKDYAGANETYEGEDTHEKTDH